MNIIIPLGGIGQRFLDSGFQRPKPLINLLLKPILFWLLDGLSIEHDDKVIIVGNKRLKQYRFRELVNKSYDNIEVIYLEHDTEGAAQTVLQGLQATKPNQPVILLDGDTFYNINILELYRNSKNKNIVFSFLQKDTNPIYSYVSTENNIILKIAEKDRISNKANTGAYAFESPEILRRYCKKAIENFEKSKKQELYTSSIISDMIDDNYIFNSIILSNDDFEVVGTPLQYKLFHNKHRSKKNYFNDFRICFDLDNTLVSHPYTKGDYESVLPIKQNIKYAQFLKNLGCTIIIYTARRMKTHNGNIGSVIADIGKITLNTIEKFEIPCDELIFGKPFAHAYIDDLAYNAFEDFSSHLGLTDYKVEERNFNKCSSRTLQVFEKKSTNIRKLNAEIYWYNNIPKSVNFYVPKIISSNVDEGSYILERIDGITFSELLVSQSLTNQLFEKLLESISLFHQIPSLDKDINIYGVYRNKLKERYENYDYSKYPGSSEKYKIMHAKLADYESENLGIPGCIHGDPVFSNVMIDRDGKIKLVDPRGFVSDDKFTIYGDIFYDYAKILQSLSGYDEIMLTGDSFLDNSEQIDMIYDFISNNYGEKYIEFINIIKDSLLFSLIPLHDNENCNKYFELIK
jgi:capsule biosynthesis phosphatase